MVFLDFHRLFYRHFSTNGDNRFYILGWERQAVFLSEFSVEKNVIELFVLCRWKQNPKMLVQFVAVIDAIMIFMRTSDYDITSFHGINTVLHNKRNVTAQVYVYFTFFVNVWIVCVFNRIGVQLRIGNGNVKWSYSVEMLVVACFHKIAFLYWWLYHILRWKINSNI